MHGDKFLKAVKMRALIIAITIVASLPLSAVACDRAASQKVQGMLREMATWYEKSGVITFKWGSDWDQAAPHEREGLIRAFADSEAYLSGRAKEINYYRNGKLVGKASPTLGIRLVK